MSDSPIDSVSTQELGNFRKRMDGIIKGLKEQIRALEEAHKAYEERIRVLEEALQAADISVGTKEE